MKRCRRNLKKKYNALYNQYNVSLVPVIFNFKETDFTRQVKVLLFFVCLLRVPLGSETFSHRNRGSLQIPKYPCKPNKPELTYILLEYISIFKLLFKFWNSIRTLPIIQNRWTLEGLAGVARVTCEIFGSSRRFIKSG